MRIAEVLAYLEHLAPPSFQESYDNSGLISGKKSTELQGILISLDCLESTVREAMDRNCNLIIAHHPIVFSGLKRFNSANYVQRTIELAIKNDIAIYAIHTNLDNVLHHGVNTKIAEKLGLKDLRVLRPMKGELRKLVSYVPVNDTEGLLNSLFAAGAGQIGDYSECSFRSEGKGTFRGNEHSNPVKGKRNERHTELEDRIEIIFPSHKQGAVLQALFSNHPYEEVAYEIYALENIDQTAGSGVLGMLNRAMTEAAFLKHLQQSMDIDTIKYTSQGKNIQTVAICGGSGSFLLEDAKTAAADAFVSADFKYHQFFDAEDQLLICDIGHYESEKFTIDLLYELLTKKITTFAVLKTDGDTNPVKYFH